MTLLTLLSNRFGKLRGVVATGADVYRSTPKSREARRLRQLEYDQERELEEIERKAAFEKELADMRLAAEQQEIRKRSTSVLEVLIPKNKRLK